MYFYQFTREDLAPLVETPRFQYALHMLIRESFFPNQCNFRGDSSIIETIQHLRQDASNDPYDKLAYYNAMKSYSLPYLSFCENPDNYVTSIDQGTHQRLLEDVAIRDALIAQQGNPADPEWYAYIHNCENLAIFLMYPLCRMLFPKQRFYLYNGFYHKFIVNVPKIPEGFSPDERSLSLTRDITLPCVFDLIGQAMSKLPLAYQMRSKMMFGTVPSGEPNIMIPANKIMDWYLAHYTYSDIDIDEHYRWFHLY